jgi:hypothetical protein
MASGRTDQCCTREENPCQLGAVHTWPFATCGPETIVGRFRGRADMAGPAAGSARSRVTLCAILRPSFDALQKVYLITSSAMREGRAARPWLCAVENTLPRATTAPRSAMAADRFSYRSAKSGSLRRELNHHADRLRLHAILGHGFCHLGGFHESC